MKLILSLLPMLFFISYCTATAPRVEYGIRPTHAGYVPARIAVLPCIAWPNEAGFKGLPLSNVQAAVTKELCEKFNEHVIAGFEDQPYMRGFSPKWVKTLTEQSDKATLLSELPAHWQHRPEDCNKCLNAPSFYETSIQDRADWRLWLSEVSKSVRNADAILLPLILYANEKKLVDRGLYVSRRSAELALILIDTNQGHLLWSGRREAFAQNQELDQHKVAPDLDFPPWTTVYDRLLVEDIWKDFPGRQTYR